MRPLALPFRTKICGITNTDDAIHVAQSGATAIGLNFYDQSSRFVSLKMAEAIIDSVDASCPATTALQKVGVFVNHSLNQIIETVHHLELDGIQLHGDETPAFLIELKHALASNTGQLYTIRALRTNPKRDQESPQLGTNDDALNKLISELRAWENAGIDFVLLDAAAPGEFGGTGKSIDWNSVPKIQNQTQLPIVLAGGLRPGNVAGAIQTSHAFAVDVASGVESSPGKKSAELVRQFVQQAAEAFAG